MIIQLFLAALSRKPTNEEIELLKPDPRDNRNEAEQVEDLMWMIFMLPEFQFVK